MNQKNDNYLFMLVISGSNCIRCHFGTKSETALKFDSSKLDVFFAETKDLSATYSYLKRHISCDEQIRADNFFFEEDRETYVTCHSLLRLILAKKLNTTPLEISIINEANNKPTLIGNPVYFNITHTRESFAIALANDFYVGIDLEKINPDMDFYSIIENFFSNRERDFILRSKTEARSRFFLLWTRKEALLKSLGTGIIDNLWKVEVSGRTNIIDKKSFDSSGFDHAFHDLFLYSKKIKNYYLSVAIPHKASINLYHLNSENILSLIN